MACWLATRAASTQSSVSAELQVHAEGLLSVCLGDLRWHPPYVPLLKPSVTVTRHAMYTGGPYLTVSEPLYLSASVELMHLELHFADNMGTASVSKYVLLCIIFHHF